MKWQLTPKQRKWGRRLLILFIIRLVLGAILYYVVVYRFKDIVQIMVRRQSKGLYAFDASNVDFSLFSKNIVVSDAVLYCTDTLHTSTHYDIKVPRIYLDIESWTQLILHRRMLVDSLDISMPSIKVHSHGQREGEDRHVSFHASKIYEGMQYLVTHLQVKSFHLQDGSFQFDNTRNESPFLCDHVNLTIRNFAPEGQRSERLFSSDDVDLTLGPQHWTLPDQRHDLLFKRLHFSSRKQLFELDSCTFHAAATPARGASSISAEKFFFNSRHMSAMYEKEELMIDTLVCIRPVLNMQIDDSKISRNDSSLAVSESIRHLFKKISFAYIDVRDGQVLLNHTDQFQATYTKKTNLKVFNLRFYPDSARRFRADSIELNLRNISFITPDSLFQLNIDEFSLNHNDLVCTGAVYGPTARNKSPKSLTFVAPSIRLSNISLTSLLKRRLKASRADLYYPNITLTDKEGSSDVAVMGAGLPGRLQSGNIKHFYQTLHSLRDLIIVPDFRIFNGNLQFTATGNTPLYLDMKKVNAEILLDKLLYSDSLIDIKRATPALQVAQMNVVAPDLNFVINNYVFNGYSRYNKADGFELKLKNGTDIIGKGLYWEILDWDLYQRIKLIQVDNIRLRELNIRVEGAGTSGKEVARSGVSGKEIRRGEAADLPHIHIGLVNVDSFHCSLVRNSNALHFDGEGLCLDEIRSNSKWLTWNNADGVLRQIGFSNGRDLNVSVGRLLFNTASETSFENTRIAVERDQEQLACQIPIFRLKAELHSTDLLQWRLPALSLDSVSLWYKGVRKRPDHPTDTITFATKLNASVEDLAFGRGGSSGSYGKVRLGLSGIRLGLNEALEFQSPAVSLLLSNGRLDAATSYDPGSSGKNAKIDWLWRTALQMEVQNGHLEFRKGDSMVVMASGVWGSFADSAFNMGRYNSLIGWRSLLGRTAITQAKVRFEGKGLSAEAGSVRWEPGGPVDPRDQSLLAIGAFQIHPRQTMDEVFHKGAWQSDYITASGDSILVKRGTEMDSTFVAAQVVLDHVTLSATRDKRMPFQHGIEKPMASQLISRLPVPFRIDTVRIVDSKVIVNEVSVATGKQGTIPVDSLNAVITGVHSVKGGPDSLVVIASARIAGSPDVRHFRYQERYDDSLVGFSLRFNADSFSLPPLSKVTMPLASLQIDRGQVDTLYGEWSGNKYGAVGKLHFYYKGLKVRILDRQDPARKSFRLFVINAAANQIILRKRNHKASFVFFVRDRERFIFNYWVKTLGSGMATSTRIKSDRKLRRQYRKMGSGLYL